MDPWSSSLSNGVDDHKELMINSQQEPNFVLPSSLVPTQHHHANESGSYPNADIVIEVSPTTLLDGHRFVCQICHKGFAREQNLSLHNRVHNMPFRLKTRTTRDVVQRKVYLCPEPNCINHNLPHALGDFGGLKKHYLRKHCTDKKHKCDKCSKAYAVESDLRAHSRTCNKKKYNCECGARFSSDFKLVNHQHDCDRQNRQAATINIPNSDLGNSSIRSTSNNNITSGISSTMSHLPSSVGDVLGRKICNINNTGHIGSSTSYIPVFDIGSNNNNNNNNLIDSTIPYPPTFNMGQNSFQSIENNSSHIGLSRSHLDTQVSSIQNPTNSYPYTAPNQSHWCGIGSDHESLMSDPSVGLNLTGVPSDIFSLSMPQQNQPAFQENTGIGYYTNLMTDFEYNNVNIENPSYMGEGSGYGSGEGSNLFSSAGFPISSSTRLEGFGMQEEHYVPSDNSNFVAMKDPYVSTSTYGSASDMAQQYPSFSSSGIGELIMPQEHNFLFGGEHLRNGEINNEFNNTLNSFPNHVTGSGVESSIINENVCGDYHQENYYGYVGGSTSGHADQGGGRDILNSGTPGENIGPVPTYEEKSFNEHGYWF